MNRQISDLIEIIVRSVLFVGFVFLMLVTVYLSIYNQITSAIFVTIVGFMCLFFAYLSRFKRISIKSLGIEAELWEQKQEEATKLADTLRSLSLVFAELGLSLSARMGRWDTVTKRKQLYELVDRLDGLLKEVDVPSTKRERVKNDFYKFTAIDMVRPIVRTIRAYPVDTDTH